MPHHSESPDVPGLDGCSSAPHVFMVGSPRSGTTMLKRMVSVHPDIVIARETHWIPRFCERRKGVDEEGKVTPQIVDRLLAHPRFSQMRMGRQELEEFVVANPGIPYAELVSEIFLRYARRKGKRLVGDKTPKYVRKLPTLLSLWPQARVIHLIRDGRDVCLSLLGWRMAHKAAGRFATWADDPVVTAALWWKALVGIGCEDGSRLAGERYLDLRYEELVARPAASCRKIAEHLGIPYVDAMPRYYEGKTEAGAGLSANAAWLPPTPGLRNWRTEMPLEDVGRFEAVAGDLLVKLGYPLLGTDASPAAISSAHEIERRFTAEAKQLKWRLPSCWAVHKEVPAC